MTDPRGLGPTGWHVPTDAEWYTLTNNLGGVTGAGGKMKSTGTTLWGGSNTGATNSSGFTGLPGGYRDFNGLFATISSNGHWWSSTQRNGTQFWSRTLNSNNADVTNYGLSPKYGCAVRLIKD